MNGPKVTSALSPFDSQLRTLIGAARRSHSCPLRTRGKRARFSLPWCIVLKCGLHSAHIDSHGAYP
jgi:hypothetical protein